MFRVVSDANEAQKHKFAVMFQPMIPLKYKRSVNTLLPFPQTSTAELTFVSLLITLPALIKVYMDKTQRPQLYPCHWLQQQKEIAICYIETDKQHCFTESLNMPTVLLLCND
ncbi:hypothetical protein PoB_002832900 [Plakobranchus ocellatus]|uniref:Uncharacterized protein n=1 Tax=Plakobranchus ocellatus TaxID=259542 RepID=A0AAV4A5G1_9GAST|nr:hypothetical protein PoB_002832900 [Plakobranchus ocellatus]